MSETRVEEIDDGIDEESTATLSQLGERSALVCDADVAGAAWFSPSPKVEEH